MGASATVTHHQKGEHGLTWSRRKKTIQFKNSPSGYSHGPFPVDPMDPTSGRSSSSGCRIRKRPGASEAARLWLRAWDKPWGKGTRFT